jgi:hypothetical protein
MSETTPEPDAQMEVSAAVTTQRLTEEERLSIENKFLRMQNATLQMQLIDMQKDKMDQQKSKLSEDVQALEQALASERVVLSIKYGTSIERNTVKADGTIKGRP